MDNNIFFLNRHNTRDSLKVLTNYLSLSKNMKTLFLHSNVRHTKQPLNEHMIQLSYFIDPWICSTCDFHTLRYTTIVTSWKYGNRYSTNTPCTRKVILVQFSHNLYVPKVSEYPSHSFTYSAIYPPPPMIYIINECPKYYSINYYFLNII